MFCAERMDFLLQTRRSSAIGSIVRSIDRINGQDSFATPARSVLIHQGTHHLHQKLVFRAPWRSTGFHDVVRARPDEHPSVRMFRWRHNIIRSCGVRTPAEKHAARRASGLTTITIYIASGHLLSGLERWCCVEA